jgi:hypothetical protein
VIFFPEKLPVSTVIFNQFLQSLPEINNPIFYCLKWLTKHYPGISPFIGKACVKPYYTTCYHGPDPEACIHFPVSE